MNVQDNTNLAVEYLEVITCTYEELCNIKTPSNGRLYHTSDTNEFYFDWNNRRHKLSVFASDSNIKDVVKKSELNAWLAEHDYVTNLSLVDELVNIIGSPIENIITKQALENYSKNYLLTKEEFGLLDEPLSLIEDIKSLQTSNRNLYAYCDRLANSINEVRSETNNRISSGELNTKLNEYLKTSLAESIYLSKDEADTLYIDEDEFLEKVQNYITRNQLTESLKPYLKKSEVGSIYATKEDVNNKYLLKTTANNTFATKNELQNNYVTKESVDVVLDDYLTKNEANSYLKKDVADSTFAKKSDLSNVETKSSVNEKLSTFANRMWVDNLYLRKDSIKDIIGEYATKEYVDSKFLRGEDDSSIDDKIEQVVTEINNKLSKYATKKQVSDIKESLSAFAKKICVEQHYLHESDLDKKIEGYATLEYINEILDKFEEKDVTDEKLRRLSNEINNRMSKFATRTQVSELNDRMSNLAHKNWVSENFIRKGDSSGSSSGEPTDLSGYATKEYVDEKLDGYATKESLSQKTTEINNKFSKYATKEQLSSVSSVIPTLAQRNWVSTNFIDNNELLNELKKYTSVVYLSKTLENYMTGDSINELLSQKITELNNKFSKYATNDQLSDIRESLTAFAKKIWVDEFYMKKFKLSEYMKADDIYSIFLEKDVADNIYLTKQDAENIYAKISSIINYTDNDCVTREEASAFAKKVWVDEYYMRKTQIEGIKNAIVLSREFAHESELKQHEGKFIQQGFYYLTAEDTLFCVIDNGQGTGEKIFVNITQLEAGFALYFGGDDVNW